MKLFLRGHLWKEGRAEGGKGGHLSYLSGAIIVPTPDQKTYLDSLMSMISSQPQPNQTEA